MLDADQALERLKQGNRQFVAGAKRDQTLADAARRAELARAQRPFAILLGCSDSRVPAEIVFHQGVGDLFVIRVVGNIVAPSLIGSVEFAAAQFGTRLVVVLGHTQCGAVQATLDELRHPATERSPNLHAIVDRIRPAVEPLLDAGPAGEALVAQAIRANIEASVAQLRHGSGILERLITEDGLKIVGAEYSLETGEVEFLD